MGDLKTKHRYLGGYSFISQIYPTSFHLISRLFAHRNLEYMYSHINVHLGWAHNIGPTYKIRSYPVNDLGTGRVVIFDRPIGSTPGLKS